MRASGILMPIFSLPGKYGIGCFSKEAYRFIDFLKESGQTYWQLLPLGPTSYGDSPYQSFSTFAGNPYFIDLETLVEKGWISKATLAKADLGTDETRIDYAKLYENRFPILYKAYQNSNISSDKAFTKYCKDNAYWIKDYALFMALKDLFDGKSFYEWPKAIRQRDEKAMLEYKKSLASEIEFYEFLQYEFACEWKALRSYANEKGILIIGDIPIYVAADSADVWAHPEMFQMDKKGNPTKVAGCPPDAFSETGQLWGNPLYDWKQHEKSEFEWWLKRIGKCSELYDVLRIDHFRGFDEYYAIPAKDETAENGKWLKGPGMKLFSKVKEAFPNTTIIAEDLGLITDSVRKLVMDSGYPNMKVLEFAFNSPEGPGASEYVPCNYGHNCVVYTGTHDNETLAGWSKNIGNTTLKNIRDYVGNAKLKKADVPDALVRLALGSVADMCIIPLQDYMGLENEARMNHPSTLGGNWLWRCTKRQLNKSLFSKVEKLTRIYGRINR